MSIEKAKVRLKEEISFIEDCPNNCKYIDAYAHKKGLEQILAELEQPEPTEFTKEIYEALTNGVGEKPYYRKEGNQFNIYVADDQLMCVVPFVEGPEGDYAEYIAKAICEAGLLIDRLTKTLNQFPDYFAYEREYKKLEQKYKKQAERIEEMKEQNRWIPVSERLPEEGQFCHLYMPEFNSNCPQKGLYLSDKKVWLTTIKYRKRTRKVTHWKPIILPEQALKG